MPRLLPLLCLLACKSPAEPEPACPPVPPGETEVRLRQLGCEADLPTGEHAAARVGDWVLENNRARFVVRSGFEGHALYGLAGGGLVDAVRIEGGVQAGPDALRELQMTVGFWMLAPESFEDVSGDGEARLRISGDWQSMVTLHEVLPIPEPSVALEQEYVLRPDSDVLELVTRSPSGDAVPALSDLQFWSGSVRPWLPGVGAYDLPQTGAFEQFALEPFADAPATAVSGDGGTLLNIGPVLALGWAGSDTEVVRQLSLGASLSEAMAPHWDAAEVTHEGAPLVEVRDADGKPLTRCVAGRPCAAVGAASTIEVWNDDGNGHWTGPLVGEVATVTVDAGGPFRLTSWGEDRRHFVDDDGEATFRLPPGEWQLFVTRGPAWTLHTETVTLQAGAEHTVTTSLDRVVDDTAWVGADLHLHSENSPDSWVTLDRRLTSALAEDLDLVVLTEHDNVSEAAKDGLVVVSGAEVSTMGLGHFNAWPVIPDPELAGNGAPRWHGTDLPALVDELGDRFVQCNHPRFIDGGYAALFDWIELDESTDPSMVPCDAVEVVNGTTIEGTEAVLADWLMLQGRDIRMTATAVSDTHETSDWVGHPRTLVKVDGELTEARFTEALAAGRAIATAGPMLDLVVIDDAGAQTGIGGTVSGTPTTARVTLQAPDWMGLGTVELLVDGEVVHTEEVSALVADAGLQLAEFDVALPADARFVVAVHRGTADNRPGARRAPWAVTNPVWVE